MENLKRYTFYDFTIDNGVIQYINYLDSKNLHREVFNFTNPDGLKVEYYFYKTKVTKKEVILFLCGSAPGHKAYLREIETFCKIGYKVITLDYSGCGNSEGDGYKSILSLTEDVLTLLNTIDVKENLILIGHSLGGYTALNVINRIDYVKKAVIISSFFTIEQIASLYPDKTEILEYEKKEFPDLYSINNEEYLKTTKDRILFIHSKDDKIIEYAPGIKYVKENIKNSNLEFMIVDKKGHNPNYTISSLNYMNKTLNDFSKLVASNKLNTLEKQKEFMKDKSPYKMTNQDKKVINRIVKFIEG